MSTTRSRSRKEPAISRDQAARRALLLVAHGERGVSNPNRALIAHARALAAQLAPMLVVCGHLTGDPTLESALAEVSGAGIDELLVYPAFMSDGYFVGQALPERLAQSGFESRVTILRPLGLEPRIGEVAMSNALAAAEAAGFDRGATSLLVTGHGSKQGRASAEATYRIADRLREMGHFAEISTAFLEEPPFIGIQLASHKGPVVVSGFFASHGMHSSHDVPAAIHESGAEAVYTGPVGADPEVRKIISAALAAHLSAV